jgi:hypothetical protein
MICFTISIAALMLLAWILFWQAKSQDWREKPCTGDTGSAWQPSSGCSQRFGAVTIH